MKIAFSLKRHASNYSTLHRSDIAAWAAPLDPRLKITEKIICKIFELTSISSTKQIEDFEVFNDDIWICVFAKEMENIVLFSTSLNESKNSVWYCGSGLKEQISKMNVAFDCWNFLSLLVTLLVFYTDDRITIHLHRWQD